MRHAKLLLRLGLAALILCILAFRIDWHSLRKAFSEVSFGWFAGAIGLCPVVIALLSLRIRVLLAGMGIRPSFVNIVRMTWTGQFFNTFLPGATGGDFYKAYKVGQFARERHAQGIAAIVLDRISALIGLGILSVVAFSLEPKPVAGLLNGSVVPSGTLKLAAGVGLGLCIGAWLTRNLWRRRSKALASWYEKAVKAAVSLRSGFSDRGILGLAVVLAGLTHLANFTAVWFLARGLHLELSYLEVLTMMPVVLFVVMLPLSINGHGLRELVMIAYFRIFHVGDDPAISAIALSLAFVATDFVSALPGGLLQLLPEPPSHHDLP